MGGLFHSRRPNPCCGSCIALHQPPRSHPWAACQNAPAKGFSFNSLPQSKTALREPQRMQLHATVPWGRGVGAPRCKRTDAETSRLIPSWRPAYRAGIAGRPRTNRRSITRPVLSRKPLIAPLPSRVNRILPSAAVKKSRVTGYSAPGLLFSRCRTRLFFPSAPDSIFSSYSGSISALL
jgi:hypothetical protein